MSVMRSSLIGSLLQVLKFNLDRKAPRVRVFELGRVFLRDDAVATTDSTVQGHPPAHARGRPGLGRRRSGALGRQGAARRLLRHQGRRRGAAGAARAELRAGRASGAASGPLRPACCSTAAPIGVVGELHPRWRQKWDLAQAPVLFELELDAVTAAAACPWPQPVPKHQAVERDIAVVVAEAVTHDALMHAIRAAADAGLLRDAVLFDIYRRPSAATAAWRPAAWRRAKRAWRCASASTATAPH